MEQERRTSRPSRRRRGIILLLASTGLALGVCEIALRVFAPIADPFLMINQPHLKMTLAPDPVLLPGTSSPSHFTTDAKGFRVIHPVNYDEKPPNIRRIFLLGGSTTESFYVDDQRTFGALLEARLNETLRARGLSVEVINAGRAGTVSADHYYVARQLLDYQPDLLIYLIGLNEMQPYITWHYQPVASELKGTLRAVALSSQLLRRIVLWYRVRGSTVKVERSPTGVEQALENRGLAQKAVLVPIPESDKALPFFFLNNMRLIADLHRRHGIKAVLMTQPTMWARDMDPDLELRTVRDSSGRLVRYSAEEREELLEKYNDVLREMGREGGGIIYCLDLARLLPKDRRLYFNDLYFSNLGHERVADIMARFILESRLLADERTVLNQVKG